MKHFILLISFLFTVACVPGPKGDRGATGTPGSPGIPGTSCSVEQMENGAILTCENGTTAVVLNGVDGQDGIDGQDGQNGDDAVPTAYTVIEVIKPCPGNGFREVLLRLYNGDLLAHFSSGQKQFLTFLTPGNYQLTDGSNCQFTVHSDLSVTW